MDLVPFRFQDDDEDLYFAVMAFNMGVLEPGREDDLNYTAPLDLEQDREDDLNYRNWSLSARPITRQRGLPSMCRCRAHKVRARARAATAQQQQRQNLHIHQAYFRNLHKVQFTILKLRFASWALLLVLRACRAVASWWTALRSVERRRLSRGCRGPRPAEAEYYKRYLPSQCHGFADVPANW